MPELHAIPSLVRRGCGYELSLYRSLLRWIARRPSLGAADEEPVGYARQVSPVMWLWIFASAVEIPIVHLLLPWESVRRIVLFLSIWGLLWMVGLLASLRVHPHLVSATQLRVRHGARIDIMIPWSGVASIVAQRRDVGSTIRTLQPRETDDGVDLQVAVSGEVNVSVRLRRPVTVSTPAGPLVITALSFLVDEPKEFVTSTRQRMAALLSSHSAVSDE